MNNSTNTKTYGIIFFLIICIATSLSSMFAQKAETDYKFQRRVTTEFEIKNLEMALYSENHGLRISVVQLIGKYNLLNFEDDLIEMLEEMENLKDKEIIALSLYQMGTLNSISALQNTLINSLDKELKEFCLALLKKYKEDEKVRSEYFDRVVVNLLETK